MLTKENSIDIRFVLHLDSDPIQQPSKANHLYIRLCMRNSSAEGADFHT